MKELWDWLLFAFPPPTILLIASVFIILKLDGLPLYKKIKAKILLGKIKKFFKDSGYDVSESYYFGYWVRIIEEALQSDVSQEELTDFIQEYIKKMFIALKTDENSFKQISSDPKLLRLTKKYILLSKKRK